MLFESSVIWSGWHKPLSDANYELRNELQVETKARLNDMVLDLVFAILIAFHALASISLT